MTFNWMKTGLLVSFLLFGLIYIARDNLYQNLVFRKSELTLKGECHLSFCIGSKRSKIIAETKKVFDRTDVTILFYIDNKRYYLSEFPENHLLYQVNQWTLYQDRPFGRTTIGTYSFADETLTAIELKHYGIFYFDP